MEWLLLEGGAYLGPGPYYNKNSKFTFQKYIFIYVNRRPLKLMKKNFYFMLKALFIIQTFSSRVFGYVTERLDEKAMVNFKVCEVTN